MYEKDLFLTDDSIIINRIIREYDMSKANINILLYKGLINQDQFDKYYNMPKGLRERTIGTLQRDYPKINQGLKDGFVEARKMLFETNNLNESNVVAVKKDAVFTLDKYLEYNQFKNLVFLNKNTYSSFIQAYKLELYYSKFTDSIDVKGIGELSIVKHQNFMVDFLCYLFNILETTSLNNTIIILKEFLESYRNGELELGYYREFNNRSEFCTRYKIGGQNMYIQDIGIQDSEVSSSYVLNKLDISYNYLLLSEILRILLSRYL